MKPRLLAVLVLPSLAGAGGTDTDGDGLSDALGRELGSDPAAFDELVTLEGLLRLPTGAPAAGASVRVRDVGAEAYSTTSDGAGRFSIARWPATLAGELIVQHLGPGSGFRGAEVALAPDWPGPRRGPAPGAPRVRWLGKVTLEPRLPGALFPGCVARSTACARAGARLPSACPWNSTTRSSPRQAKARSARPSPSRSALHASTGAAPSAKEPCARKRARRTSSSAATVSRCSGTWAGHQHRSGSRRPCRISTRRHRSPPSDAGAEPR